MTYATDEDLKVRLTEALRCVDMHIDASIKKDENALGDEARIAELTRPRVVDDALVEEIRQAASEKLRYWPATETVAAILAALPPNLSQPVELTDAECDRLLIAFGTKGLRDGIRNVLAAAGRYTKRAVSREELGRVARFVDTDSAQDKVLLLANGLFDIGFEVEGETYDSLKEQTKDIPVTDADRQNWGEGNARVDRPEYDRLPYVGLTKLTGTRLERILNDDEARISDAWDCIRIIAKALGAGGDR